MRRALTAQVVVHAPTLTMAHDLLCRSYRNNTAASCCFLPGACPVGAPDECTALCRLAVAAAPAHCGDDDNFEAWHKPLAELYAAHDICADEVEALGCGDTLSAGGAAASDGGATNGQQLCQREVRASPGQRVRLEFTSVAVAPGAFLFAFDGTTQVVELQQIAGGQVPPPGGIAASGRGMLVTLLQPLAGAAGMAPTTFMARVVCKPAANGGH